MTRRLILLLIVCLELSTEVSAGALVYPTYGVRRTVSSNFTNNFAGERMAAHGQTIRRGNRYYLPGSATNYYRYYRRRAR